MGFSAWPGRGGTVFVGIVIFLVFAFPCVADEPFAIENRPNDPRIHAVAPDDCAQAVTNPPAMVFWYHSGAATYTLQMARDREFADPVVVKDIDLPFYNHHTALDAGAWFWRYCIVTKDGKASAWSPVRSFIITKESLPFPVPPVDRILNSLPDHPRVYVTKKTLPAYRERRNKEAKRAFGIMVRRGKTIMIEKPKPPKLGGKVPPNPKARAVAFWLKDGEAFHSLDVHPSTLEGRSVNTEILAMLYLITGERKYADAARDWLLWQANFRLDWHQEDKAHHDTVHCYEYGLKRAAVVYDYIHDALSPEEREKVLDHIQYHGDACYRKLRYKRRMHLKYQTSHAQQDMHELLTTALAVANDLPDAKEWLDYLIRQYVNRLAWGKNDGGYSEGHYYNYKWHGMVQCAVALKTATGIDLFQKPRFRNAGRFWLYCMSLNYWWAHYGDIFSLHTPMSGSSNDRDGANYLASVYGDRYVKWWADQVDGSLKQPLWYLSDETLREKPPVDIPQAGMFPDVGWAAMYDRFYDNRSTRLFFKSSPWGSHSHCHQDQNGFVIHAFGEILAIDKGYYGHYGDKYHQFICRETKSHNSILVNGEGQDRGIQFNGKITHFANAKECCAVVGDATAAYGDRLKKFLRAIVFIRPNTFVVYDQLEAAEPSTFSWQLNALQKMALDEAGQTVTIAQRGARLRATHLLPGNLTYRQSNQREYGLKSRYTEAFPEQWTCWCETREKARIQRFLTILDAYQDKNGPAVESIKTTQSGDTVGVSFDIQGKHCTVQFRDDAAKPVHIVVDGRDLADTPVPDLAARPAALSLKVTDSRGEYDVPLEPAVDAYGTGFHFARLDPREQGRYGITTDTDRIEILVQDKWGPAHNTSGREVELREGSMLIVSVPPGVRLGRIEATLTESYKGRIVSLVRNGGFEVGTPGYPPISWWVRHFSTGDMSYPFWSDKGPAEGKHCLKLFREKSKIRCYSQGIEIAKPGRYVLRCKAKATCRGGSVNTWGTAGSMGLNIEPSTEWKEYRVEANLQPGTACIHCMFDKAEGPNQTLMVDDIEFGRVAE